MTESYGAWRASSRRSILAAPGLAFGAGRLRAACSPVVDSDGAAGRGPGAAATAYEYPAVHDMPPPRATPTMTEEQQVKLEKELTAVRDRQEAQGQTGKKTAQPRKRSPRAADNAQAAGAKTNP